MTDHRAIDVGFDLGEKASQAMKRALQRFRGDPERLVIAMGAIGAPLAQAGRVFAGNDVRYSERMRSYVTIAALTVARCAGRKPGDPDPREEALKDYHALIVAGRMPPLDGGGA